MSDFKNKIRSINIKKSKHKAFKNWWRKNKHIIARILLFPIWIVVFLHSKYKDFRFNNIKFTKEKCKLYLDIILPKLIVNFCESSDEFLISNCYDMHDIRIAELSGHLVKNKYGTFFTKFPNETKKYIIDEYRIDGYDKMSITNWMQWDEAKRKFGWRDTPFNKDYVVGTVFYIKDKGCE